MLLTSFMPRESDIAPFSLECVEDRKRPFSLFRLVSVHPYPAQDDGERRREGRKGRRNGRVTQSWTLQKGTCVCTVHGRKFFFH